MFRFTTVNTKNELHINFLYEILKVREFNISHEFIPTYKDHKKFVLNHPYRHWLIIKSKNIFVGSVYLTKDNVIGINLPKAGLEDYYYLIKLIIKKYKPLKEVKSVNSKYFLINTNPQNRILIEALEKLNMKYIQKTYAFDKDCEYLMYTLCTCL